jgi:IS30 family transposase
MRQFNAAMRRIEVERRFAEEGFRWGARARIARELHVHPSTITRDLRKLWAPEGERCPTCERAMSFKEWEQLEEDRTTYLRNVLAVTRATSEVA